VFEDSDEAVEKEGRGKGKKFLGEKREARSLRGSAGF